MEDQIRLQTVICEFARSPLSFLGRYFRGLFAPPAIWVLFGEDPVQEEGGEQWGEGAMHFLQPQGPF